MRELFPAIFCKLLCCWVILLPFAHAGESFAQDKDAASKFLEQGEELFKQGKYRDALTLFDQVIQLDSENVSAYYMRTVSNFFLQDYSAAISDATKTTEIVPMHYLAYNFRGLSYYHVKNYPDAILDFSKAIACKPDFSEGYACRGSANYWLKKYSEAIDDYTKALELDPGEARSWYNRALVFFAMGKAEEAEADLAKAKSLKLR